MFFDDRLATVLRHRATGERAARTQFRQLLDLLGSRSTVPNGPPGAAKRDQQLLASAWLRLGALGEMLPANERAAMIRDPGLRFRNPDLAAHLAEDEPDVAVAALARAELSDEEWQELIPRLPVRARGFLRLRRDMPASVSRLLDRLGIHDRGLPMPALVEVTRSVTLDSETKPPLRMTPANDASHASEQEFAKGFSDNNIGVIVKRIEAFRRSRSNEPVSKAAPHSLPIAKNAPHQHPRLSGFAFTSDAEGRIDWAEPSVSSMVVGKRLSHEGIAPIAFVRRQPLHNYSINLEGAPLIAGPWVVDAAPRFTVPGGRFYGYAGKFRRPARDAGAEQDTGDEPPADSEGDRVRELLHELRTPVNAIQGFSEIIQQQLFGPTPHEYRALAASIAGDSARILAGFDELERLARLETGALDLEEGSADLAAMVEQTCDQLQDVLKPKTSGFSFDRGEESCIITLSDTECEALGWRLLATLASAIGDNEIVALTMDQANGEALLRCDLPVSLNAAADIFAASTRSAGGSLSASVFGAGFALRLVRAEARAAGGDMVRKDNTILLRLPLARGTADSHPEEAANA